MNRISDKEQAALEHVINKKNLEPYFFDKLIQKKDVRWIEVLKSRGFFDKTNIPIISEGSYIEDWNILHYVHSIIDKLVDENDKENISYILLVLLQAGEISKNYRVFSQSVKIIKNIPLSDIPDTYLNSFLEYWLQCDFGLDYILKEIEAELLPYLLSDSSKLLNTFEQFFKVSIDVVSTSNYILKDLLENKAYALKILEVNPQKVCKLFIELLEKECFITLSTRDINEQTISIENINNQLFKISNVDLEKSFSTRQEDIDFIISNCESSLKNVDKQHLERICKLLYSNLFDANAYESIFEEEGYLFDSVDYLIKFIKLSLTKTKMNRELLVALTKQMLESKYDIVKKLGIFAIVKNWNNLKDDFFNILKEETSLFDYIFRHYTFDDETKHLFELLNEEIDKDHIALLEMIINEGEYIFHERKDQSYNLKWKQKRYKALSKISLFKNKYMETKKITNIDIELSAAIKPGKSGWIEDISPYTREEIIKMSINELVTKMRNFREHDKFSPDFKEISYRGFGREFKNVLVSSPDDFIDNLDKFNGLQYEFIYYLLDGFSTLIKQNVELDYTKVLEFIISYMDIDAFWEDALKFEKENDYLMNHEGIVREALNFITNWLFNDKINFIETDFNLTLDFIKICLDRIDFGTVEDVLFSNEDISFYSLNSLGGKYVRALLELALKLKRKAMPRYEAYWQKNIKPIFNFLMENKSIDSYVVIGEYISNFSYIDEKWVKGIIEDIAPQNEMWQYFVTGYLDSRTVYSDLYKLMEKHYLAALQYNNFHEKDIKEKIGSHIAIGYINGLDEKTEVSLMQKLLDIWDIDIIGVVIRHYFNVEAKQLAQGVSRLIAESKILDFWSEFIKKCAEKGLELSLEEKDLVKESIHLVNNFSTINESIIENLNYAFKYVAHSFEAHHVVEYCHRLVSSSEDHCNELIISLTFDLFNECIPSYPEEAIKQLLNYLKDNNEVSKLNRIQHTYFIKTKKSFVVDYISKLTKTI
ncbi:hypothetical protein [Priestia sp. LL-8]|uniref:hypothetical protein n=1 Tax=Priestia sp. LL-8 TaxID=3110068 RepID=UPI002E2639FC|nr:hypothetical protein [Priestia sp. LL-8]